jgi:hypothetical protein
MGIARQRGFLAMTDFPRSAFRDAEPTNFLNITALPA